MRTSPEALDLRSLALVAPARRRAVGYLLGELAGYGAPSRASRRHARMRRSRRCRSQASGRTKAASPCCGGRVPRPARGRLRTAASSARGSPARPARETAPASSPGCSRCASMCSSRRSPASTRAGQPISSCASTLRTSDGHATRPHVGWRKSAAMYVAWAERRGMRLKRLSPDEHLYAISGLGAERSSLPRAGPASARAPFEPSGNGEHVERVHVRVDLAVATDAGPTRGRALAGRGGGSRARAGTSLDLVVRRYRFKPAPLVRDAVRGYRTGRSTACSRAISTGTEPGLNPPDQGATR